MLGGDQLWGTPRRRWDFISWWYSLLLVVAVLGIAGTTVFRHSAGGRLQGVVLDAYSGEPIDGATITAGTEHTRSNGDGHFRLDPKGFLAISIEKPEYDPARLNISTTQQSLKIKLRPNTVHGTVTARDNHKPVSGAAVEAKTSEGSAASATTDDRGKFTIAPVREGTTLIISRDGYATKTLTLNGQAQLDFSLRSGVVTGVITDDQGKPLPAATIAAGNARATSGNDGTYRLEGIPDGGSIAVKSPGYRASFIPIGDKSRVDAKLERFSARAIYAGAATASKPDALNPLIDLADRTEVNAIVVDLKDSSGDVYFDTKLQLAHDIGAVHPAFEVKPLLDLLHQHNIYAIARIVVFEDPVLAEARPDWAIHDTATGDLWRTWNGLAWVNAHRPEV